MRLSTSALVVVLAHAALLGGACSGSALTESCGVAGRERRCGCGTGAVGSEVGIQACQLNGTWEPCTCYPLSGSGTGGSRAGAGGVASVHSGVEAERDQASRENQAGATAGTGGSGDNLLPPFPFAGRRAPFPGRRR